MDTWLLALVWGRLWVRDRQGRANLVTSLLEGFKHNINIPQRPDPLSSDICEQLYRAKVYVGAELVLGFSQTQMQ